MRYPVKNLTWTLAIIIVALGTIWYFHALNQNLLSMQKDLWTSESYLLTQQRQIDKRFLPENGGDVGRGSVCCSDSWNKEL